MKTICFITKKKLKESSGSCCCYYKSFSVQSVQHHFMSHDMKMKEEKELTNDIKVLMSLLLSPLFAVNYCNSPTMAFIERQNRLQVKSVSHSSAACRLYCIFTIHFYVTLSCTLLFIWMNSLVWGIVFHAEGDFIHTIIFFLNWYKTFS